MIVVFDKTERDVRTAMLRVTASVSWQGYVDMVDLIPKSRKYYAITIKENRSSMNIYLEKDPLYYLKLVREMMIKNPNIREAIWIEELDSLGKRHIHGLVGSRRVLRFKELNDSFYGVSIWLTRTYEDKESGTYNGHKCDELCTHKNVCISYNRWIDYCFKRKIREIYVCLNKIKY